MKIEDARKIIQEESLQGYNLCEERENRENEVVLKKENEKWIVYVTDERASKITNSVDKYNTETEATLAIYQKHADDYMVKPIDIEEMLLRIQVLLRRSKSASEKKIQIGDLLLNYNQLSVIKKDKVYNLAQKEFYLLYKLLSTPNTIFTRQELIEEVWGLESDSDYRTVDVHIKRIREKMKDVDEFEIVTIRGIGYKAIIHEKG